MKVGLVVETTTNKSGVLTAQCCKYSGITWVMITVMIKDEMSDSMDQNSAALIPPDEADLAQASESHRVSCPLLVHRKSNRKTSSVKEKPYAS